MKYNKAINMAISAVTLDKNLTPETRVEIIEALAKAEELADIGQATEKAFDYFSMGQPSEEGTIEFDILSVEDLLEWAESEGE